MLKIVGTIIILISSGIYGFVLSGEINLRYKELLEIKKAFFLLKSEIEYNVCPIREALCNVSSRCARKFGIIFQNIAESNEKNFYCAWEKELKKGFSGLHLSKNDEDELLMLKDSFGLSDRMSQINQIDLYLLRLETSINSLAEIMPQKMKMYKCLSIGIGIMISLVII